MRQESPIGSSRNLAEGSGRDMAEIARQNLDFVEHLYDAWSADPDSVDPAWAAWFASEQNGSNGEFNLGGETSHAPLAGILTPSFKPRSIFNAGQSYYSSGSTSSSEQLPPYDGSSPEKRVPFLHQITIFRGLSEDEVLEIARAAEELSISDGQYVMRQGEVGQEVFVVTEGVVKIVRDGRLLALLSPGEVIGEMSVLDEQPRSADAVARGHAKILVLRSKPLRELVQAKSALALGIVRVLTQRLRDSNTRQDRVDQLIRAYRVRGHLMADLDPLGRPKEIYPELDPSFYGFTDDDMDVVFSSTTIPGREALPLKDILEHLRATYCRNIGVQFMHIDDLRLKSWLQDKMESTQNTMELSADEQIRILTKLTDAEILEQFIHKKFIGAKRFSLEGAESMIPLLDLAIETAGAHGIKEVVIGMAHRGRLNVLANVLDKPVQQIFREFDDQNGDAMLGRGDVKYHLGYSADRVTASGNEVHLSLAFNPSHLEFVSPVVNGRIRAKQDRHEDSPRSKGMSVAIHGDAAFAGQGVVQETLNLSQLSGYTTGGTLHLIVNNQIGFTTLPEQSRSTQYATDVAKLLQIPIFHVNGEKPEAVAHVIRLAMAFREEFKSDVIIDMYCYRRYGHNEGDEPAFTQPDMYKVIRARESVRESYVSNLKQLGHLTDEQAERIALARRDNLEQSLDEARATTSKQPSYSSGMGYWKGYLGGLDAEVPKAKTAISKATLKQYLKELGHLPAQFTPHPKFGRLLKQRTEMVSGARALDWAAGEALAFASLVGEGRRVRLTGQDSERGTFSHRHSVLHDSESGEQFNIYEGIAKAGGGVMEIHNSPLSEIAVLAFEYGYSLDYPEALVMWEAQFGDFANVAQVIIDQFITSGEEKWSRLSGLVMMLPHGFEGQGPEHSSARLERFLTAAAEDNIQVCNVTTPAQLFHMIRRQVIRPLRKPLVLMSPKSLLRHPRAVSSLDEFSNGTFQRVIPDVDARCVPGKTCRILLTSGKLYYELAEQREKLEAWDISIVRLEQYYPISQKEFEPVLAPYKANVPVCWVQEEPKNMGAWAFLRMQHDEGLLGDRKLTCISRPASASPATGSAKAHRLEQTMILEQAFARD